MKPEPRIAERQPSLNEPETSTPAVTILMSVYNGARFVREAIESILRQTWTDFEFLIINDGSSDRTREIITSFGDHRIRLLDNRVNIGLTKSLNLGLESARGALVARQDADDISHPERLAVQVEFMRANPDVALVGTQVRILNEHGGVSHSPGWETALTDGAIRFQLMFGNPFIHTTVLFRHVVIWEQLGGYDESFVRGEDFELWSRVTASYPVHNLRESLVDHRSHSGSLGSLYPKEHLALCSAVVEANLCKYLQLPSVPSEWPGLISSLHINPAYRMRAELAQLPAVADMIFERFIECHPEQRFNQEIRRVVARTLAQVACRLTESRRLDALRTFNHARRFDAGTTNSFALKFFSLLLLGGRNRVLMHLKSIV